MDKQLEQETAMGGYEGEIFLTLLEEDMTSEEYSAAIEEGTRFAEEKLIGECEIRQQECVGRTRYQEVQNVLK